MDPNSFLNMTLLAKAITSFLIWMFSEAFWVGFFFPLIIVLRSKKRESANKKKKISFVWLLGIRRVWLYKFKILFASIGGVIITNIYWLGLNLSEKFLPSALYLIVLSIGSFILGFLLFLKGNGIVCTYPSSLFEGAKYIWAGFMNPFDEEEVSKMKKVVKCVNMDIDKNQ